MAVFISAAAPRAQAEAFMAPRRHAAVRGRWFVGDRSLFLSRRSSTGARVDQVQQPREEEGEEGGEALLLRLGGRVRADGVS